jgi:hypothetical protein
MNRLRHVKLNPLRTNNSKNTTRRQLIKTLLLIAQSSFIEFCVIVISMSCQTEERHRSILCFLCWPFSWDKALTLWREVTSNLAAQREAALPGSNIFRAKVTLVIRVQVYASLLSVHLLSNGRITGNWQLGKDVEGCGTTVPAFAGGNEEEHEKPQLGQLVFWPRFEPGTSRIQFRRDSSWASFLGYMAAKV